MLIIALIALGVGYVLSANLDELRGIVASFEPNPVSDPANRGGSANADGDATPAASPPAIASEKAEEPARAHDAARGDARNEPVTAAKRDAPPVQDVSGRWAFTHRVESSAYKPFNNLTLVYRVELRQQDNRVTGSGHKWSENGRTISAGSRTPISFEGTLNGRRLELKFTERGRRRASGGTLLLDVADDGSLRGSFLSDAAQSRGSSQAQRIP